MRRDTEPTWALDVDVSVRLRPVWMPTLVVEVVEVADPARGGRNSRLIVRPGT
jgi:hypothetical protein